jgi:hypothetical protein
LTVSLQGQPSAICYLPKKAQTPKNNKKTMHWRAFSPPPIPKCVTQNVSFCSLVVVFLIFVGFVQD